VDLDSDHPVYFFEICFTSPGEAAEIVAELIKIEGIAGTATRSQKPGLVDIHITSDTATKEHSTLELQNILGVSREQTIGVGDDYNDLHLFRAVGHRVAMGNAVDALKQLSDEIIDDVRDDGLATYFERLARDE
jgi:hydroxymethylpyrimidine pyrophosphatase-like HAD family hydrolase